MEAGSAELSKQLHCPGAVLSLTPPAVGPSCPDVPPTIPFMKHKAGNCSLWEFGHKQVKPPLESPQTTAIHGKFTVSSSMAAPHLGDETLTLLLLLPGILVSLLGRKKKGFPQLLLFPRGSRLRVGRGCTHQAIAGAEGSQPSLQRPAPHLPDHVAGVVGVRLDLGAGDASETPLADEARSQEVPVEAQVEFQGLPSVLQLVEGRQLAPGGGRPPVKGPVGQIVGQEGSALVDLDGMDDVAAGERLCEEGVQWLPAGVFTFPPHTPSHAGLPGGGVRDPDSSRVWSLVPTGTHGAGRDSRDSACPCCPRGSASRSRIGPGGRGGVRQLRSSAVPRLAPVTPHTLRLLNSG